MKALKIITIVTICLFIISFISCSDDSSGDSVGPDISKVEAIDITDTEAKITWKTNELATSQVIFSIDKTIKTKYMTNPTEDKDADESKHKVNIKDLLPGTKYYYQVISRDKAGNTQVSKIYEFETDDLKAPIISAVNVSDITENSAKVTWKTDEPATSQVEISEHKDLTEDVITFPMLADTNADNYEHSVALSDLKGGIRYYFQVISKDKFDNTAKSTPIESFYTYDYSVPVLSDIVVIDISISSCTVTWKTNEYTTSQVIYSVNADLSDSTTYPENEGSADTKEHSVMLEKLNSFTKYYFKVISKDSSGKKIENTTIMSFVTGDDKAPWLDDSDFITNVFYDKPVNLNFSGVVDDGTITEVMISTTNDFTSASWESFSETYEYSHSLGDAEWLDLYVKFKDDAGNVSEVFQDSGLYYNKADIVFVSKGATGTGTKGNPDDPFPDFTSAIAILDDTETYMFVSGGLYNKLQLYGEGHNLIIRGGFANDFREIDFLEHKTIINGQDSQYAIYLEGITDLGIQMFYIKAHNSLEGTDISDIKAVVIKTSMNLSFACNYIYNGVACYDGVSGDVQATGIYINESDYTSIVNNLIIAGDVGDDNAGTLDPVSGKNVFSIGISTFSSTKDCKPKIFNNTIVTGKARSTDNALAYGIFLSGQSTSHDTVASIINNAIFRQHAPEGSGTNAIGIREARYTPGAKTKPERVDNNLIYDFDFAYADADSTVYTVAQMNSNAIANTSSTENITATSGNVFIDETGGSIISDFNLKEGSPAIDKGMTIPNMKIDILGKSRPVNGTYDIGAFERR